MNTYTFNIILQDGDVIADSITAGTRKEAERMAYDKYEDLASIELIQVN